jgi:hypothetical protein
MDGIIAGTGERTGTGLLLALGTRDFFMVFMGDSSWVKSIVTTSF